MKWNVLAIAALFLMAPAAVGQNDAAGESDDSTTAAGEDAKAVFGLGGILRSNYTAADKEDLKALASQYEARGPFYEQSAAGALFFGIDGLHEAACQELYEILDARAYVRELEECRRTDQDTSPPREDMPPEEKEESDEPDVNEEKEPEKDEPSEVKETDNRDSIAAACEQKKGEDREECFEDYCEDPHPKHAETCKKWLQQQRAQDEREDAQKDFRACKDGATSASERMECAEEYSEDVQDDDRWDRESKISQAREEGKLGARVSIRAGSAQDGSVAESEEYDVDVEVVTEGAKARDDDVDFRVTVSAELLEGRTIVLDVDPALLSGPTLVVRYFDVFDDGSETEVIIRQASDLVDVLDANDDDGQPEYWIVKDTNGLQLIASVPHWSVHAITVQGIGEFVTTPSVIAGIAFGVVGSVMAAAVLVRPRKDDDA